jgi:transposase
MEIITGVERRRRWRVEDKLRIVAEAERPGARFVAVARRHEVSRGPAVVVARPGAPRRAGGRAATGVHAGAGRGGPAGRGAGRHRRTRGLRSAPSRGDAGSGGMIEIALPDGTVIRVGEEVGLAALRRVVAALRA